MKIAISAAGPQLSSDVDLRFGRAKFFIVTDTQTDVWRAHDNACSTEPGAAGDLSAGRNAIALGVGAVVTGTVDPAAIHALKTAGVAVFPAEAGTVQQAIIRFKSGHLKELAGAPAPRPPPQPEHPPPAPGHPPRQAPGGRPRPGG